MEKVAGHLVITAAAGKGRRALVGCIHPVQRGKKRKVSQRWSWKEEANLVHARRGKGGRTVPRGGSGKGEGDGENPVWHSR